MSEFLVFFETSGNQSYVYATNKLRENIGASELTYRAGTRWVLDAAGFADAPTENPPEFRTWLRDPGKRKNSKAEVILSTSGKALLLVQSRETATNIVANVTRRAVDEAPGLSITGAIVELEGSRGDKAVVDKALKKAHERFNANRDLMPTPSQRYPMLPFMEPCVTSGLPASHKGRGEKLGAPTHRKREATGAWFNRIREVLKHRDDELFIARSADELETEFDSLSWLGVVYSDGNGLGQIMMRFKDWLEEADDYLDTLRAFSIELDSATEAAFYSACMHLGELGAGQEMKRKGMHLPVVPLLLGGDDVTVLVHGDYALPFSRAFLLEFEKLTTEEHSPVIARIAQKALDAGRLSAGAGVAIVKKHFPFHSAHGMAEALLKSAKRTKQHVVQQELRDGREQPYPCSSLDFHILFDAAFSGLADIREKRRTAPEGEQLWGGPYVVTPLESLSRVRNMDWARFHHLDELLERVKVLRDVDDEGRYRLPSSQTHMLREAVAQGKTVADARLQELKRLEAHGLKALYEEGESLFTGSGEEATTRFLDALSSAEFWADAMPGVTAGAQQ